MSVEVSSGCSPLPSAAEMNSPSCPAFGKTRAKTIFSGPALVAAFCGPALPAAIAPAAARASKHARIAHHPWDRVKSLERFYANGERARASGARRGSRGAQLHVHLAAADGTPVLVLGERHAALDAHADSLLRGFTFTEQTLEQ